MKTLKKKLISILTLVCVCCCALLVSSSVSFSSAEVISVEGNFYTVKGAAIRLKVGESGIRYSTVVSEDFYNSILTTYGEDATVEFYTVIGSGKNFDKAKEYKASGKPTFDSVTKTYTYNEVIYYDNLESDLTEYYTSQGKSGDELTALVQQDIEYAYATELNAKSYVKVMPNGQQAVTIDAKYNDTLRSMRGVAIDLLVSGEYNPMDKTNIESYVGGEITVQESSEVVGHYDSTDDYGKIKVNIPEGEYTAYYGARKVGKATITAENKEITLDGVSGLSIGQDYPLSLYDAETNTVYKKNFKYVTKILTKASDLAMFKIVNTWDGSKATVTSGLFDGYYVLGNDINASGYTHQNGITGIDAAADRWFATQGFKDCGLTGTFDGNGYSISSLTIGRFGLFGLINGGTVKNLGLKAITLTGANCTTLCWYGLDATIENVYLYLPELPNIWGRSMVASCLWTSKVNNLLIRNEQMYGDTGSGNYGSFISKNVNSGDDYVNKFSNIFIIAPKAATMTSKITVDGINRDCENVYEGVMRWNSMEDLKNNVNYLGDETLPAIEYSSFTESGYWYLNNGYLTFGKI